MSSKNQECGSILKKALPLPPPFPSHKANGLRVRENCWCALNAVNTSLDRLFDEAYRADVSIFTENGDVIYAHASILVSFSAEKTCICIYVHNKLMWKLYTQNVACFELILRDAGHGFSSLQGYASKTETARSE